MKYLFQIGLLLLHLPLWGQIVVDINPNYRHLVENIDTFNRKRMVKIHASHTEQDWTIGNNFGNDTELRDTFLNGLDVYLGRNTGPISWWLNQMDEDPNRQGFADPSDIAINGQRIRNNYAANSLLKTFEARNELVIAAQQTPFFPDGTKTAQGWSFANGTATGEFMGRYINEFHGGNGQATPPFVEIMNEPAYMFITNGNFTPREVFSFHNEVADAIREQNSKVQIGGYVTAFPNFEEDNFQRWRDRWKLFMDMSGDRMDFWSIHLYDFNLSWSDTKILRRGANIEATFDMMDHYSYLSFNEVKPFVISEYGGRALTLEANPWSPGRDWLTMKSMTSMLLTFSERPQLILSAIPFIIVKAEWGRQADGAPYPWRLMRQNKELAGQSGDHWVYTELVKFYQLWSDVKGTRIDSESTDPDMQTNAYVDGHHMYVILNNLDFEEAKVLLNLNEKYNNHLQNIRVKHLFYNANEERPALTEQNFDQLTEIAIGAEGSVVIEYTFEDPIIIDELVEETKFFAKEHLSPIIPYAEHLFHIDQVTKGEYGEAVLRLGMGRPHEKSLRPIVKFNGNLLAIPSEYAGYDQLPKESWFGLIEIPVPFAFIQENNLISVQFPDNGGHISSMALRVFNQSTPISRSDEVEITSLSISPSSMQVAPGQTFPLLASILPNDANPSQLIWSSSDTSIAKVDPIGRVTALRTGQVSIQVSLPDSSLMASSSIEVVDNPAVIALTGIDLSPEHYSLGIGEFLQMQANLIPTDASNQSISWTISDTDIASIDTNGLVEGKQSGEVQVIAKSTNSEIADTSQITIEANFPNALDCGLLPNELVSDTEYEVQIPYTAATQFDLAVELKDPNGRWVGEGRVTVEPGIGTATINIKNVSTDDWTTPVFPEPKEGYALLAWIRQVGGNWTTNMGGCSFYELNINPNVTNITPVELSHPSFYPNPGNGILQIELPSLRKGANLSVFDFLGSTQHQQKLTNTTSTIDLTHLAPGVYLIRIHNQEGGISKKIIIE